jgi:7-carboxy-7-deazaguanine synthase
MFETIQGEGAYTGIPSVSVRLQGCPVGCPWCDTKHTWDTLVENESSKAAVMKESIDSPTYFRANTQQLLDLFDEYQYQAKHIVITGGEPCMFDLRDFTENCLSKGYTLQIETSGTFEIKCHENTWVTLSPKIEMKGGFDVLNSAIFRANEIKHPIAMAKHIDELDLLLQKATEQAQLLNVPFAKPLIYLQPISQQTRATELAIKTCIERNWRLSVQLHKYIGIE